MAREKKVKAKPNWLQPDTTAENEVLPGWFKWAWSARGVSFALNYVLMLQVTYFCTDLLGMDPLLVGGLLLGSKIVDAITDLIFGYIIDKTDTKWGKARPYDIFVPIMWIFTIILFAAPNYGIIGKSIYIFVMYALVNAVASTFVMAADPVYMSRAIRSDKNKMKVTSFQGIFIMLFSIIASTLLPQLIKGIGATKAGWPIIAAGFGIPMAIIGSIRMFIIPEAAAMNGAVKTDSTTLSIKEAFGLLLKNNMGLLLCLLNFLVSTATAVNSASQNYYFKWILGDIGLASLMGMLSLVTPIVLIFAPLIARRMGNGKMLKAGMVLALSGYAIRTVGAYQASLALILLGSLLSTIGIVPISTLLSIYEMECMDYGEWKNGTRVEGMVTSAVGFTGKVGSAIGSGILGLLMSLSGYVSSETATSQPESALAMMPVVFALVPLILVIIAVFFANRYRGDKDRPQMEADLAERRKAQA